MLQKYGHFVLVCRAALLITMVSVPQKAFCYCKMSMQTGASFRSMAGWHCSIPTTTTAANMPWNEMYSMPLRCLPIMILAIAAMCWFNIRQRPKLTFGCVPPKLPNPTKMPSVAMWTKSRAVLEPKSKHRYGISFEIL
jgi:hypothetical protein